MQVTWNKCKGEVWGPLNTVDLTHKHFDDMDGVYVIWHMGPKPRTVRVGQGFIRDRLTAHRNDKKIQAYAHLDLFVTWASVSSAYKDGVEAYLANQLDPIVGDRFPDVIPILVNLPW